jgi:hypothetical protein
VEDKPGETAATVILVERGARCSINQPCAGPGAISGVTVSLHLLSPPLRRSRLSLVESGWAPGMARGKMKGVCRRAERPSSFALRHCGNGHFSFAGGVVNRLLFGRAFVPRFEFAPFHFKDPKPPPRHNNIDPQLPPGTPAIPPRGVGGAFRTRRASSGSSDGRHCASDRRKGKRALITPAIRGWERGGGNHCRRGIR